jgi:hypothetical protein
MHTLRDAGYIDFVDGAERTRTILIPFIEKPIVQVLDAS